MDEVENRTYINNKIHPIFERLVIDLLLNKPDEPIDYM
jgi:S-adenosylmethionine:diacylglycerol 3-amino-3-carboxypropyl transferase